MRVLQSDPSYKSELGLITPYKLRPYQEQAVKKMLAFLKLRKGCYNACEMGLGKTIQSIVALNTLGVKRVLIVCPAIMRLVWKNEYLKWNTIPGQIVATVLNRGDLEATTKAHVVIISYDMLSKVTTEKYLLREWDCLIMDEAHYLKNHKAIRTKAILGKYWPRSTYRIAMSGTPFTKSVMDAWAVWKLLAPEDFSDWHRFAYTYTNVKFNGFAKVYEGVKNVDKLRDIIRSKFFIRYQKSEVEKEIPAKNFIKVPLPRELRIEPPNEDLTEIDKEIAELERAFSHGEDIKIKATGKLIKNRREQGLRKVDDTVEFVKDILDQNIPLVLFGWHRDVIDEYRKKLQKYVPGVITGDTPAETRQRHIEDFQSGKCQLIIANILAGGIGITLTKASTCVFAEFDYSPANLSQAISRLHRIGQLNTVNIYYLVVEDSLEERILKIVMQKVETFEKVLEERHARTA